METFLGRFRNLIVLAVILFAQLVGLAVQVKLPAQEGSTRLIRLWAVTAITPFEKAVIGTQDWVKDTWQGYVYLRNVRKENQQLRDQIDRMKLDEVRLTEDANMARRIQTLLAFKEQYLDTTVAAQVIGTSGSEQSRVIYIDKGSRDGLKPDMAVITPTGIVGKIVQVFPDSSQVLPINDPLSGVGVALKDTRLQGILRGGSNGATTVQYVMADEKVTPGEEVITSGGDRIFPKGLPVGKVVDVQPGKDLFLNIRVIPAAQLDRLEEVLVVTKMLEKPPDSKDLGPIRASDILAERLPTYSTPPPAPANANAPAGATGASTTAAQPGTKPQLGQTTTATTPAGSLRYPTSGTIPNGTTAAANSGTAGTAVRKSATVGAPGTVAGTSVRPGTASTSATAPKANSVAVGAAKPKASQAGTLTPSTPAPTTDAISDVSSTAQQPPPVKRVIVEADPAPKKAEQDSSTSTADNATPAKPTHKAPQQAPTTNGTQTPPSPQDNASPQR